MEDDLKRLPLAVVTVILCSYAAQSQLGSGTIVVYNLTQDKLVIAADSRATYGDRPPDDMQCKISAFRNHIVFAAGGAAYYIPPVSSGERPWDAIEEAKTASTIGVIGSTTVTEEIERIADAWAISMQANWNSFYLVHPDLVRETANEQKGLLTDGIFVEAKNGEMALTVRAIRFTNGLNLTSVETAHCEPTHWCASGQIDVFMEFANRTTPRAVMERDTWFKQFDSGSFRAISSDRALLRTVRFVDLAIAYDITGTIGGPIDAIEMGKDGSIYWFMRKTQCPEYR